MFEKILIPLDGSDLAEIALPYGSELAERLGSRLELFHVCGPEHLHQMNLHKIYLSKMAETIKRSLGWRWIKDKESAVTTNIEIGEPRESICTLVEKNRIDLVVMTAIGSSGFLVGKMIGSVADHVCRNVPVPVMLIKPQQKPATESKRHLINQLFLTVDGSELSMKALPVAQELATRLNVPISLFQMAHIVVPYSDNMAVDDAINFTLLSNANEKSVRVEMESLESELKEKGLNVKSIVVAGVNTADNIIDESVKAGADLIVMATHGRSGVGRFLFGNVAEKVLHHSDIPVLLVNARA